MGYKTNLFEAMIARIQYRGSEELALVIPYRGIWQHTRYTNRATTVHRQRSRKGTCQRYTARSRAHLLLGVLHFRHESTEGFADMKDIDYTTR